MSLPEETLLLVEHRYVCSECSHLSPSLEEALLHHQQHLQPPAAPAAPRCSPPPPPLELLGVPPELEPPSQFQCLECGALLVTPGQLLEHQELHLKLLEPPRAAPAAAAAAIHFECPECRALFQSQELWLAHRQGHRAAPRPPRVDLDHSYRKPEDGGAESAEAPAGDAVQLLLYECGECLQLFQSPKDFLEHQSTHLAPCPAQPARRQEPGVRRVQEAVQHRDVAAGAPAHPHRRAAVPLPRLRQGLPAVHAPQGPPAAAHGRAALPLPGVRQELRHRRAAGRAPAHPHRGAALRLPGVRQGLPLLLQPLEAPQDAPGEGRRRGGGEGLQGWGGGPWGGAGSFRRGSGGGIGGWDPPGDPRGGLGVRDPPGDPRRGIGGWDPPGDPWSGIGV